LGTCILVFLKTFIIWDTSSCCISDDMYVCKVSKIGVIKFEGKFLRKKPSIHKDSGFMLFVYPQVSDEYEFMYDQVNGN